MVGNVNYSLIQTHMNMHLQVRRPSYVFIDFLSNFYCLARAAWSLVDPGTGLMEQRSRAGLPHLINYLKMAVKNLQ